jgi:hypothetical protein
MRGRNSMEITLHFACSNGKGGRKIVLARVFQKHKVFRLQYSAQTSKAIL